MSINLQWILIYYAIVSVIAVIFWRLSFLIKHPLLRIYLRVAVLSILFTPWFSVTEGVAIIPASIMIFFGCYYSDIGEILWGFIPIVFIFLLMLGIYYIHKRAQKTS